MKQILNILILLTIMISGGCKKSPLSITDEVPEGMVELIIDAHSELSSDVATRAAENDMTGHVMVMVFDKTDIATAKLKQKPVMATLSGGKIKVMLYEEKTDSYLLVLANISTELRNALIGSDIGTSLMSISQDAVTEQVTSAGLKAPFPISGWSTKLTTILRTNTTLGSLSIPLKRIVARVDVNSAPAQFKIHSVQMVNAAKRGYIIGQELLPYFSPNDVVTYKPVTLQTPAELVTESIYCYENRCVQGSSIIPMRVVIFGTRDPKIAASYYGIDIIYEDPTNTAQVAYHIERNKKYTVTLNVVKAEGYASFEEAARATAFNELVDADIVVSDPYAFDITSNGKQYLGVTNSEFVVYPATPNAVKNVMAATISYTCADDWSLGRITTTNGIKLLSGIERLEVQSGSVPISRDIIIEEIPAGFTEGEIKVEVGNLLKIINVRVKGATLPSGQVFSDYHTLPNTEKTYLYGEIINPSPATSWLKVSPRADYDGSSSLNDKLTNLGGGIFVNAEPFLDISNSRKEMREASLYVTGSKSDQRIRVLVQQKNAYSILTEHKPYGVVATFHRWNQTAERIIDLDVEPGITWWQATIFSGRDFAVLSDEKSIDHTNIANNSPMYSTDEEVEANCQVNSVKHTIYGGNHIYFRVGLKSKLASATSKPRYGLILLAHGKTLNVTDGVHLILIRQGEAADYVMRPSDAGNVADFSSLTRPKAVKFSPYNLTDVQSNPADLVDRGAQGYSFVKYPSQGGHYFLSSGSQAISPAVTGTVTGLVAPTFDVNNPWKDEWDKCPKGYRLPKDGDSRTFATTPIAGDVARSEVRQSLWLNPTNGANDNTIRNTLYGFLSDGYFDRHQATLGDETVTEMPNAAINKGTVDAAYGGVVIFNVTTYASIFMPFSGKYEDGLKNRGNIGAMQLKTAGANNNDGWLMQYGHKQSATPTSNYTVNIGQRTNALHGYTIRCIKDENPNFGTDDSQIEVPGTGETQKLVSIHYNTDPDKGNNTKSLQQQIEAQCTEAERKLISDLAINATKTLDAADYLYLNNWADNTSYKLQNMILRGTAATTIPTNAITSNRWMSILFSNANVFAKDAITTTSLVNLFLGYFDPNAAATLNIGTAAGGNLAFPANMPNTNLHLRLPEFKEINQTTPTFWDGKGITAKAIYLY